MWFSVTNTHPSAGFSITFGALNDGMCGTEDVGSVHSEGKKTEKPAPWFCQKTKLQNLRNQIVSPQISTPAGSDVRLLLFGRCCCHFPFHGSALDVSSVQFANHKHLVEFSFAETRH